MTDTDKLIEEQFRRLPSLLQNALELVPWKSTIKEIALLRSLSFEQVSIIERETMFILYGFESPDDYIANIMREAEIPEETAIAIANDAGEKIFNVISKKVGENEKSSVQIEENQNNTPHNNLPMVEPGETARIVARATMEIRNPKLENRNNIEIKKEDMTQTAQPVEPLKKEEKPTLAEVPNYTYPKGKDPYREPIE